MTTAADSGAAQAALVIEGIHKRFDAFVALQDIHLTVKQGEMLCFLGPSGCGKTTLLRIIAGLEVQTSGRILQQGHDISWLPPNKRDYGIVFQSYALFPNLTCFDNISYGLVNRRLSRQMIVARVEELLKLVGLAGSGGKYPNQLSGGQQQRVALARALAVKPGLLLLDEPLSALDALERVRLRGEIRSLQQKVGVTTILVTHDQEEALSVADRIVVMNHGVIEQIGTPQDVYAQPTTPFVADFVGKVNILNGTTLDENNVQVGGLILRCDGAARGLAGGTPVRLYLRPEDVTVRGVTEATPNSDGARVTRVEFLGAFCHAQVHLDALNGQALTVHLPVHDVQELGTGEGMRLRLALRGERIRLFPLPK